MMIPRAGVRLAKGNPARLEQIQHKLKMPCNSSMAMAFNSSTRS